MSDPFSMAVGAIGNVVNDRLFGGLTVKVTISGQLEAATFKTGVEPPQIAVPVIQYSDKIEGIVELVAPPGVRVWFGGLTVSLRVAKLVKHGGEPVITPEMKDLPAWMRPKATPVVFAYDAPTCESRPFIVLDKGKYIAPSSRPCRPSYYP